MGKLLRPWELSEDRRPSLQFPLAADTELRFLFSPTNVQINSPLAIAPGLLQPFLEQRKEILLVSKGQYIHPALLKSLDGSSLTAVFPRRQGIQLLEHLGKELLALFPIRPQQHYILQARLAEVYLDRVKLQYLDPRYDTRRRFSLDNPIPLALIPPTITKAVEYGQIEILREIVQPTSNSPAGVDAKDDGVLCDFFCQSGLPVDLSIDGYLPKELPTLFCTLQDISCGGIGLKFDGAAETDELMNTLGLCRINLPDQAGGRLNSAALIRTLQPLCVIRAVRSSAQSTSLHLRFLRRLPEQFAALFEDLEDTST